MLEIGAKPESADTKTTAQAGGSALMIPGVATAPSAAFTPAAMDPDAPIGKRIDAAYIHSLECAIDAVKWVIEAGDMLIEQHTKVPDGEWLTWLAENCEVVSQSTAYNLMKSAKYVHKNGSFSAQTVRQLYLEAGVIKEAGEEESSPRVARSILMPMQDMFKNLRRFYSEKKLEKLQPVAVPQLLGYVREAKAELVKLEARLVEKMDGKKPAL